ncbi:MAG: hypothetical protein M0Z63_13840 [Actinomycetota bacterium]|nr:hypothetical protein [Actinomycetota bacterium]MDA8281469.1 hypothetical protein [Actinomycetota bacterium]
MQHVAVVDDDEVSRRGLGAVLGEHPDIDVVALVGHADALAGADGMWADVDVAIVDAADERHRGDQFPGVAVVERVRRCRPAPHPVIVVRTGHFLDDALRLRMREAGADLFFHRCELQQAEALHAVVLRPEEFRAGVPAPLDVEALFRLGIGTRTRVNAGVAFLERHGMGPMGVSQRSRRWTAFRKDFNDQARIVPVNADGTLPALERAVPSLPQIQRFKEWATRSKR